MSTSRLVIITTATGLALGCGGLFGGEPTSNPPPPDPTNSMFQEVDGSCYLARHPPQLVECPPLITEQIARLADGTCQASGSFDCPDGWSCSSGGMVATDCPPQLGDAESIMVNHPFGCRLTTGSDDELTADCPEALVRPRDPNYRIELNDDATCTAWFIGDDHCPEGASCNPPPPATVPCPPELLRPRTTNPPPTPVPG